MFKLTYECEYCGKQIKCKTDTVPDKCECELQHDTKFKIGEWVVDNVAREVFMFTEKHKENWHPNSYLHYDKWEPKEDEWISVSNRSIDKTEPHRVLRKFYIMDSDNKRFIDTYGDVWAIAEPLIAICSLNNVKDTINI